MIRAVRDAGLSALIALGLFAPLIGLVTENGDNGLVLRARGPDAHCANCFGAGNTLH